MPILMGVPEEFEDKFSNKEAVCVVSLVEGDHKFWASDENKSKVRDLYCAGCKKQVVMSNEMFEKYNKAEEKPRVMCVKCAFELMEKENGKIA